jgi:hypothetical protein
MRIGTDENFLSIERDSHEGGYPVFHAEAVSIASGRKFTASHDRLMLDTSEAVAKSFSDFQSHKSEYAEIPLSESGWLRFSRDNRGYIAVNYRIAGWKSSVAVEGEIYVEGEFTNRFCREIIELLRS